MIPGFHLLGRRPKRSRNFGGYSGNLPTARRQGDVELGISWALPYCRYHRLPIQFYRPMRSQQYTRYFVVTSDLVEQLFSWPPVRKACHVSLLKRCVCFETVLAHETVSDSKIGISGSECYEKRAGSGKFWNPETNPRTKISGRVQKDGSHPQICFGFRVSAQMCT